MNKLHSYEKQDLKYNLDKGFNKIPWALLMLNFVLLPKLFVPAIPGYEGLKGENGGGKWPLKLLGNFFVNGGKRNLGCKTLSLQILNFFNLLFNTTFQPLHLLENNRYNSTCIGNPYTLSSVWVIKARCTFHQPVSP
jgi:hypothetical protein